MLYQYIKSIIREYFLKKKFCKFNTLQSGVILSKDLKIGKCCFIGENSILGKNVILKNNTQVGRNTFLSNIEIGENSIIEYGVICTGHGNGKLKIGRESYIGINNVLDWSDNITIGNYVHVAGPSTGLWTHSSAQMCMNNIKLKEKDKRYRPTAPIVIEDNIFIGGNCTIYPGVTIHHHSIVSPNSVVNKDVEPYSLVGGVPAKFIKRIEPE